jgi:hypothetical protein
MASALAAAKADVAAPIGLGAPTDRPHEPVTAGIPSGPGPNSLPTMAPPVTRSLSEVIAAAAAASGSPDLKFLAQQAARFGQ